LNNKILISTLLALGLTGINSLQAAEKTQTGFYLGGFGGGGTSDNDDFSQSGVAYKRTGGSQGAYKDSGLNGNLLVDVTGHSDSKTSAMGGLHVGYEFSSISFGGNQSGWQLRPAVELEGYYLGSSMSGNLSNNNNEPVVNSSDPALTNIAASEHKFTDSFNLNMGVLLANSIFNLKTPWSSKILPYIGGGIGGAITSLSGANSTQTQGGEHTPYESNTNHFNSNTNASGSAFAAQAKAGIRAEIIDHVSVFAEYRYLHVTESNYTFGSTEYGNQHAQTSNWNVGLGSMNFHTGVFGMRYEF
jgi:opacity protein-like surface antigen